MANPEHVRIVRQGAAAIDEWWRGSPQGGLDLSGADLRKTDLSGAHLSRGVLNYPNFKQADLRGVSLGNAYLSQANLCEASLGHADLSGADLSEACLQHANLSEADLRLCNLCQADLREAVLGKTMLAWANLVSADLRGASLREADLHMTDLAEAELREADLHDAFFSRTVLANCDLSKTHGLDSVRHRSLSPVDIHTIIASKGKIPEVFLRGCGVPEEWITHIPALLSAMQPIQFYSCFISYSHADKSFARRLHDTLQGRGIRCWLDEHQLLPGDDPHEQIDRGIRLWDKVLLCASKDSLTSWWVDNEIATAFDKERLLMKERGEKVLALIPLDLDGYLFSKACPNAKQTQLKTRIAAKFAGWDKDNALFEREFGRLIKALQTNDTGREPPPTPRL